MSSTPHEDTDPVFLWDMLDAARAVVQFTAGKIFQTYETDRLLRAGVERCIEIIGEAARMVSREFQNVHEEIPWQKIVAQRHVLIHEYGEIRNDLLWRVATVHIPDLIKLLEPLFPPGGSKDSTDP